MGKNNFKIASNLTLLVASVFLFNASPSWARDACTQKYIVDESDAQKVCRKACSNEGKTWNGHWCHLNAEGCNSEGNCWKHPYVNSVCGCKK